MLEGHIYINEKLRDLRSDEAVLRAQSGPARGATPTERRTRRKAGIRAAVATLRRAVIRPAAPAS